MGAIPVFSFATDARQASHHRRISVERHQLCHFFRISDDFPISAPFRGIFFELPTILKASFANQGKPRC